MLLLFPNSYRSTVRSIIYKLAILMNLLDITSTATIIQSQYNFYLCITYSHGLEMYNRKIKLFKSVHIINCHNAVILSRIWLFDYFKCHYNADSNTVERASRSTLLFGPFIFRLSCLFSEEVSPIRPFLHMYFFLNNCFENYYENFIDDKYFMKYRYPRGYRKTLKTRLFFHAEYRFVL